MEEKGFEEKVALGERDRDLDARERQIGDGLWRLCHLLFRDIGGLHLEFSGEKAQIEAEIKKLAKVIIGGMR